jgi:molybdate transport system ATP-binding protein
MSFHHSKPGFLSLRDAAFRLGDRVVFENLNWQFNRGEQWAIIGPNGSGKSVFGDAIRGRVPLVQGELRYHFRPPPGLSPEEAIGHVAFEDRKSELHGAVVQSRWTSFEEEASISVRDFLSYDRVMEINPFEVTSRHKLARPRFERRMRRVIYLLQLAGFLSRTLLSLSNGERQRVQLARALAQPLRLLILDEPYLGLDIGMREYFRRILRRLLATPLRILLITTRLEDLPPNVTHLLRVEDCRVIAAGPRAEILPRDRRAVSKLRRVRNSQKLLPGLLSRNGSTKANLVDLRNVTVRYGDRTILRKVSWSVRQGESWVLLGPNGSGKTTLLSLILGDNPQAYVNEVLVFGQRRGSGESIWQLKKRIGWVSPELQLHFNDSVSVVEVVLSGFQETIGVFETPTRRQVAGARRWLKHFGLLKSAELPLFSLSAGMQRMALLARALVKRPLLLILDEPCQGLDPAHRDLFIQNLDLLIRAKSLTAIFVTHRPEEIPPSISRVLRLSHNGAASFE